PRRSSGGDPARGGTAGAGHRDQRGHLRLPPDRRLSGSHLADPRRPQHGAAAAAPSRPGHTTGAAHRARATSGAHGQAADRPHAADARSGATATATRDTSRRTSPASSYAWTPSTSAISRGSARCGRLRPATAGPQATLAAREATKTIPIVMIVEVDPIENGLVASLSKPGGNVTGFSGNLHGLGGKRLELFHEAVPRAPP